MKGKVAVASISLLLVVGVIIGVIATVGRSKANDASSEHGLDVGMVTGMKAVETLCAPTEFKEVCKSTLAPTALNDSNATPKDLVEVTFKAIKDVVQKVMDKSDSLANEAGGDAQKAGIASGCRKWMDHATYDLDLALARLSDDNTHSVERLTFDFKNWLSAVVAYKSECMDDIGNQAELKSALQEGLVSTTQLTYNALAIVDVFANIISRISGTVPVQLQHLQLRNTPLDKEGFPSWVSAADRRLLKGRKKHAAHVTVAQDGSGNFKTIQEAVNAYPKNHRGRFRIHVKAGNYSEIVKIPKKVENVFMYGDGPKKTIVTGNLNFGISKINTSKTATFSAEGNHFMAKSIGFINTAGPQGHQAVALRTESDEAIYYDCEFHGYQDTLYYQAHKSFFSKCTISGTVDFIFGKGECVIQNSVIMAKLGMKGNQNMVTADGRETPLCPTGLVIQSCDIRAEPGLVEQKLTMKSYLGRPWKPYSRVMIMQSTIGDFIEPEGWKPWQDQTGDVHYQTCQYMEYDNKGPGADVSRRVNWPHYQVVKDRAVAEQYTAGVFLRGGDWLPQARGIRYNLGLSP